MTSETKAVFTIIIVATLVLPLASASHYYGDSGSSSSSTEFSLPQYDSHADLLGNLVAPFLLIFLLFQIGIQKALMFAFADDDPRILGRTESKERKKIKKYSILMSLTISGMIIPSPLFQILDDYVAVIFGGSVYILFGAVFVAFLIIIRRELF